MIPRLEIACPIKFHSPPPLRTPGNLTSEYLALSNSPKRGVVCYRVKRFCIISSCCYVRVNFVAVITVPSMVSLTETIFKVLWIHKSLGKRKGKYKKSCSRGNGVRIDIGGSQEHRNYISKHEEYKSIDLRRLEIVSLWSPPVSRKHAQQEHLPWASLERHSWCNRSDIFKSSTKWKRLETTPCKHFLKIAPVALTPYKTPILQCVDWENVILGVSRKTFIAEECMRGLHVPAARYDHIFLSFGPPVIRQTELQLWTKL